MSDSDAANSEVISASEITDLSALNGVFGWRIGISYCLMFATVSVYIVDYPFVSSSWETHAFLGLCALAAIVTSAEYLYHRSRITNTECDSNE